MWLQNRSTQDARPDSELVSRARAGDTGAFADLTERYLTVLRSGAARYSAVCGEEADDFFQEGFLALYRAVQGYDSTAGGCFTAYARACIRNSMRTEARKHIKHRQPDLYIDDMDESMLHAKLATGGQPSTEDACMERETGFLQQEMLKALLSDFEWNVLRLFLRGHSYTQISALLSTTTKAVDNALQRVRRKMKPENQPAPLPGLSAGRL